MECMYCKEEAEFKCTCEITYMCKIHFTDHKIMNKAHSFESLTVLDESKFHLLSTTIQSMLKKIKEAKLEIISNTKSIVKLIKNLQKSAIKKLDEKCNYLSKFIKYNKYSESDMLNIKNIESKNIILNNGEFNKIIDQVNYVYKKNFIEFSPKKYWEKEFLEDHSGGFSCGTVADDGKLLVIGGRDTTIRVWDIIQKKQKFVLHGHNKDVSYVIVTGDSQKIISGSFDTTVRIWDIKMKAQVALLKAHKGEIIEICYLDEKFLLFTLDKKCELIMWDFNKHTFLKSFDVSGKIYSLALMNTLQRLILGLSEDIIILEIEKSTLIKTLKGHSDEVTTLRLTNDNKKMISVGLDHLIIVWDMTEFKIIQKIDEELIGFTKNFCLSPDDKILVSGDDFIIAWNLESGRKIEGIYVLQSLESILQFNQNLIFLTLNSVVYEFELVNKTYSSLFFLKYFEYDSNLFFSNNGRIPYLCINEIDDGNNKSLWDYKNNREDSYEYSLFNFNYFFEVSERGSFAMYCSSESSNSISLMLLCDNWEYFLYKIGFNPVDSNIIELEGHEDFVNCAKFILNDSKIASGSRDKTVRLWDLMNLKQEYVFLRHGESVDSIKFIDKKKLLVSAGGFEIFIWDLNHKTIYASFNTEKYDINRIFVTDDEKFIILAYLYFQKSEGIHILNLNDKRLELNIIYQENAEIFLENSRFSIESLRTYFKR